MTWREVAAPRIAAVLAANRGADPATLRKALHDAYPWGERRYHPYRVWCDEIARQTGRKPKLGTPRRRGGTAPADPDPRQGGLF